MRPALKLNTTVLPGHRIEVVADKLPVGVTVELIVLPELSAATQQPARPFKDVIEFLDSLTPVERSPEEWTEVEREFQEERSWPLDSTP
jgi:hypothetical protein